MKKLNSFFESPKSLIYILIFAFIIRLIWIFLVKTLPTSDFKLMYDTGNLVAHGNFSAFHGHEYFERFPHDSITVLYISIFFKFLSNPLLLIKILNVIYETFAVFMIYKIGKNMFNQKIGNISALLIAIFPPFIMYCSETMAENMAIPLFLVSVYLFFKFIDNDNLITLFLSCIFLSLGDLFRPVGMVFLIAYAIYYIIKKIILGKKTVLFKTVCIPIMVIGFIIPTIIISNILVRTDIFENQIWNPGEPIVMTMLIGTNYNTIGAWNAADSAIPKDCNFNKALITKVAETKIENRFKTHSVPQILGFYAEKLGLQWGFGDFGAYGWTVGNNPGVHLSSTLSNVLNAIFFIITSIYYLFLIIASIKGLFNLKNRHNGKLLFLYLTLLGFIGFYVLTERQSRYAFVCSWLFVLTAASCFYKHKDKSIELHFR